MSVNDLKTLGHIILEQSRVALGWYSLLTATWISHFKKTKAAGSHELRRPDFIIVRSSSIMNVRL